MIFLLRFFLQNLNFKNILPTGIKILLRIFPTGCDLIFWFLFVATYGQVAAMAGNPKMSRAVGNALHKNPDSENIPCFRVVNFKGELAGAFAFGGEGEQAKRLEEDGVEVKNGKVDLKKFGINSN